MVLILSVEGDNILLRSKKGREKKRIHIDEVEGVDLGTPNIGFRIAGSGIPGFVKGIFRSDIGKVWCDYGKSKDTITLRMVEGSKYAGYVYGVDDPVNAHSAVNDALARLGRGVKMEPPNHKSDEEKLREMIENSKYE